MEQSLLDKKIEARYLKVRYEIPPDDLRNLFISEGYFISIPKSKEFVKNFLIQYKNFSKDISTDLLDKYYTFYIDLISDFKYKKIGIKRYNIHTCFGLSQKQSSCSVSYYLERGYSIEYAKENIKLRQNTISIESFIKRYGEEIGHIKYEEYLYNWKQSFNATKHNHKDKNPYTKTINPDTGIYYTREEGFSKLNKHRAKLYYDDLKKKGIKPCTVWNISFWTKKGYSESEAKDIIYNMMFKNNLEILCDRYGEEKGTLLYNKRMSTFKNTLNKYTDERKLEVCLKRTAHRNNKKYSSASIIFFEDCFKKIKEICDIDIKKYKIYWKENEFHLYDDIHKKVYFYDLYIKELNLIIEYNGHKFHPYKNITEKSKLMEWKSLYYNVNGLDQREKDINKEKLALSKNIYYLTIWDNEDNKYSQDLFINTIITIKNKIC